ncbi:hypothetical protein JW868_04555 [Candidatus Woesearchaeota archaeon]|nr:hypothetical protein [Candidatus Woesearchaeota archaeon]
MPTGVTVGSGYTTGLNIALKIIPLFKINGDDMGVDWRKGLAVLYGRQDCISTNNFLNLQL